jgi:hypothetical protein
MAATRTNYELSAGDAAEMLPRLARISDRAVLFSLQSVRRFHGRNDSPAVLRPQVKSHQRSTRMEHLRRLDSSARSAPVRQ